MYNLYVDQASPNTHYTAAVKWEEYEASVSIELNKTKIQTVCSGVLIRPDVVLTAAHCLADLRGALVSNYKLLGSDTNKVPAKEWVMHPGYLGNDVGKSVDLGLIFLDRPLNNQLKFPITGTYVQDRPFLRIGFGLRAQENRRTLVTSNFESQYGSYLRVRDQYGHPGDSGGPVFQNTTEGMRLIGVHTGRQINTFGPLNISYIQPLSPEIESWIQRELLARGRMAQANH